MRYRLLVNLDSHFDRGYRLGDTLAPGYSGAIDCEDPSQVESILWRIFDRHNRDDRPDGLDAPSFSIGYVAVVGESAFTLDRDGQWIPCRPDGADILHLPYKEAIEYR